MSERHVSYRDIMSQVDFTFRNLLSSDQKLELRKIILSNNGSVLDEVTLPTTALMYFVTQMNLHCPNIKVLTLETRPEYVDEAELEVLARAIEEGDTPTTLEVAIGFEAYDERIRNDVFQKGLSLEKVERMAGMLARQQFGLKAYLMLKPIPDMTEEEGVEDSIRGVEFFDSLAKRHGVDVNVHLNPTYAAVGTPLERAFKAGAFTPPKIESVMKVAKASEEASVSLFLGLYDEGLAVEGGSFREPGDDEAVAKLEAFNRTQDYGLLR
jgi:radical SAM enzyme (TIGR01210 family)